MWIRRAVHYILSRRPRDWRVCGYTWVCLTMLKFLFRSNHFKWKTTEVTHHQVHNIMLIKKIVTYNWAQFIWIYLLDKREKNILFSLLVSGKRWTKKAYRCLIALIIKSEITEFYSYSLSEFFESTHFIGTRWRELVRCAITTLVDTLHRYHNCFDKNRRKSCKKARIEINPANLVAHH